MFTKEQLENYASIQEECRMEKRETEQPAVYALVGRPKKQPKNSELVIKAVRETIEQTFYIDWETIMLKTRKREISEARHAARYLLNKYGGYSLQKLIELTGGSDHTTFYNSKAMCLNLMEVDRVYRGKLESCMMQIERYLERF